MNRLATLPCAVIMVCAACSPAPTGTPEPAASATPVPVSPSSPALPTPLELSPGDPAYVIHVAVDGNDANPGTEDQPFASLEGARDVIRKLNASMQGPIVVYVHGGTYSVRDVIKFEPLDSGMNGFDIIYRAAEGELPILSGGVSVTGWAPLAGSEMWHTTLTGVSDFRQLYVNGVRGQRAASAQTVVGNRWAPGDFSDRDGIVLSSTYVPDLARPQDLELHWLFDWKDMRLPVEDVARNADGTTTLWMQQPSYAVGLSMEKFSGVAGGRHYWIPKYDAPFYLENAAELLDEPGEWYYNAESGDLSYLPRDDEDLSTAEVIIPQAQSLLEVKGRQAGYEVHNLVFQGLAFEYAGWSAPSATGRTGNAGNEYLANAFDTPLITPAHVQLNSARDIVIEGCRFEHLGALGLHLVNNAFNVTIQGNLFSDISDGAILVGHPFHAYMDQAPLWVPAHHDLIANNLITNVGAEYWGSPALKVYYTSNLKILHNEISNVPHTGIAVGSGWQFNTDSTTAHDNFIGYNLVSDLMQRAQDGGGLKTLGQNPGTVFEGNVVRRMESVYGCIYPDNGSAFITWVSNVCDQAPYWLFANNGRANGIHDIQVLNSFTNVQRMANDGVNSRTEGVVYVDGQDWPPEAEAIIDQAGLEPEYAYLHGWLEE